MRTVADLVADNRTPPPLTLGAIRARLDHLETMLGRLVETFGDLLESVSELRTALADADGDPAAADPGGLKVEAVGELPEP